MMTKSILKKAGRFSVLVLTIFVAFISMPSVSYGAQKPHKEMKLKMHGHTRQGMEYIYYAQKIFPDYVNKRGKGIVHIDMYWGNTLMKSKHALAGLRSGAADIIMLPAAYLAGSMPILGIQSLPVWGSIAESFKDLKIGSPLYKLQNEELKKKNIYQLASSGQIPNYIFTAKKLIRTPGDMKGLKLRVPGRVASKVLKEIGAVPVSMPSAEIAQSLQRGIIDGVVINPWSFPMYGVVDLCKYMLVAPFSGISAPLFVLWDKWKSWPEDVRRVLMEAAEMYDVNFIAPEGGVRDEQVKNTLLPAYEKYGLKAIYPTKETKAEFRNMQKPLFDWWVKEVGEDVGRKALKIINIR